MSGAGFLRHPLLDALGVEHGFGTRGARDPDGLRRARQVHGAGVIRLAADSPLELGEGDAIVSDAAGMRFGVATADCVPVLLAAPGGAAAAIHAGWRGLARGVVASALREFGALAPDARDAVAVIGPHVGPCCYEVDAPVVEPLERRFGAALRAALRSARPGHWRLDLGRVARLELERLGLAPERIGGLPDACTACDPERFHSYRRDGASAGRLIHHVSARRRLSSGPGARPPNRT